MYLSLKEDYYKGINILFINMMAEKRLNLKKPALKTPQL